MRNGALPEEFLVRRHDEEIGWEILKPRARSPVVPGRASSAVTFNGGKVALAARPRWRCPRLVERERARKELLNLVWPVSKARVSDDVDALGFKRPCEDKEVSRGVERDEKGVEVRLAERVFGRVIEPVGEASAQV